MSAAPRCRCCGKPLTKWTNWLHLSANERGAVMGVSNAVASEILGVKVIRIGKSIGGRPPDHVTYWDGKSWGQGGRGMFCTGRCAEAFGYAVAAVTSYICYKEE